jgi:hypothetical protein
MADDNTRKDNRASMRVALGAMALAIVVVILGWIVYVQARQFDWALGRICMGLLAANGITNVACSLRPGLCFQP